jgi:hypothetical protein
MTDLQVTYINQKPSDRSCQGITFLGGPGPEGSWKWSVEKVIANIDANKHTFFTEVGGKRRKIDVKNEPNKASYLKTRMESEGEEDPLLGLPNA